MIPVLFSAFTAASADWQPSDEAYAIFSASRAAVRLLARPRFVRYVVSVSVRDGNRWKTRSYDSVYDGIADDVMAASISREEAAHPPNAYGTDVFFAIPFGRLRVNKPMDDPDFLGGSPRLAPRYFFGIETLRTAMPPSTSTDPGPYVVIGRVHSATRAYDVGLVGDDDVSGRGCWHLALRPLRDPARDRIREMWVDRETSVPLRVVTDGDFDNAWTSRARWTSEYQLIGGQPFLLREVTSDALRFPRGRVYQGAVVTFSEFSFDGIPSVVRLTGERRSPVLAEPR